MAMAAGKSAGKPPKMTDKAFKPPTDAAMAMTGNERLARAMDVFGRAALAGRPAPFFVGLRPIVAFCFFIRGGSDTPKLASAGLCPDSAAALARGDAFAVWVE